MRLGQQVINWGEGVFFPNGINTINPVDVHALLTPGAQLKEALIPVKALYGSIGLTENLSFEAFVQFEWEETKVPGCGTYYSTTDLNGDKGCEGGFYSFGGESGATVLGEPAEVFNLPVGKEIEGDDNDQFGLAIRYFIEDLGVDLAGYYVRYNSRLPLLSGNTPDFSKGVAGVPQPIDGNTSLGDVRDAIQQATIAANSIAGLSSGDEGYRSPVVSPAAFLPYAELLWSTLTIYSYLV